MKAFLIKSSRQHYLKVINDDSSMYLEFFKNFESDKSQFIDDEANIGQYFLSQSRLNLYFKKLAKSNNEFPIQIKLPIKPDTPKRKKRNNVNKFSSEYLSATPIYINDDDSELTFK